MQKFSKTFLPARAINPFALTASTNPDSMYYHQTMREPDWDSSFKACKKSSVDKKSVQADFMSAVTFLLGWYMAHC